jgi:hypothetical protein
VSSIGRRVEALEARIVPPTPAGERPVWYTPEQWAKRERKYAQLFEELDALAVAAGEDPEEIARERARFRVMSREEIFAEQMALVNNVREEQEHGSSKEY